MAWKAVMTKLPLNHAYLFTSLAFVLVMMFSVLSLGEALNLGRATSILPVMAGLVLIAQVGG